MIKPFLKKKKAKNKKQKTKTKTKQTNLIWYCQEKKQ